jgi:hypothetical protein
VSDADAPGPVLSDQSVRKRGEISSRQPASGSVVSVANHLRTTYVWSIRPSPEQLRALAAFFGVLIEQHCGCSAAITLPAKLTSDHAVEVTVIDYPGTDLPADVTWPRIGASMLGVPVTDLEDRPVMLPDHLTNHPVPCRPYQPHNMVRHSPPHPYHDRCAVSPWQARGRAFALARSANYGTVCRLLGLFAQDRTLFRPDISPVGENRTSIMRCWRSLLSAVGCCCCCHRCCQPLAPFPIPEVSPAP